MKRKILSRIIFIFIISNILIFNSFSNNVKGIPFDIDFVFVDDIIYENNSITNYQTPFNLRYKQEYTKLYNASYSFTNELNTTSSTDITFVSIDISGVDTSVNISNEIANHSKVLHLIDNSGANSAVPQNIFTGQVSGTIEFWWYTDYLGGINIRIDQEATFGILLRLGGGGTFDYRDLSGTWQTIRTLSINTWYHIKIDFECGGGSYLGLNADRFFITINRVKYGEFEFRTVAAELNNFVGVSGGSTTGNQYYDGFGYSWLSNYTINQNLFPFLNKSNTLMEIDRYEFAMSDIDTFYPAGADNPNGWSDIEIGGGDKVGIAIQGNVNGLVYSDTSVINDERGIEKSFGISGNFLNVSFSIKPEVLDGGLNDIFIIIDSLDSNDLTVIKFTAGGQISHSILGAGLESFTSTFTLLRTYEFNLLIDDELSRVFAIIKEDGAVIETKDYGTTSPSRNGIEDIQIYSDSDDNNRISYFIDYVGVYNNGIPQVGLNDGFGLSTILLEGVSNWNYEHNNLFNIIANGTFHLGAVDGGNYFRGSTLLEVKNTSIYIQNETAFFNLYDTFISEISIPRLVFTLVSGSFNVSYLKITGVLLNETGTSNSYHLKFTHDNVDITESYFYVSNNKLRFIHNSNDTNLEFIQAGFSIEPVSSSDISVSFNSVIQNNALGFFRVNFTDTSNLIQIGNIERTLRFILSQNLTINDLIVLVSDTDINSVSGFTTGFVSNIKFLITANISASIITDSLINMMIPLIMIIIPSLALSNRYGKNIIIPMFLLMSIICVASSLIPVWLFFVIAISCSLFIIKRDDIK